MDVVECLIQAGADVHKPNSGGVTPFAIATQAGHPEVVEILAAAGGGE